MKQIVLKIGLCVLLAVVSISSNAQIKEFQKYASMEDVTYVYISKFMLKMAGMGNIAPVDGVNLKKLMKEVDGIQVISTDGPSAHSNLRKSVTSLLSAGKYETLMQINEDDTSTSIYYINKKEQSAVVLVVENKDNHDIQVIVFSGKFKIEDVMQIVEK